MHIALIIGRSVVAALCAFSAFTLSMEGKPSWGWFLAGAVFIGAIDLIHKKIG